MSKPVAFVLPLQAAGAKVYLDDSPSGHSGTLDWSGYRVFDVSDGLVNSYITVEAPGYQFYRRDGDVIVLPPGDCQLRIGVGPDPTRPQDLILPALTPLAPPSPPVPHLKVRGNDFVDEHGARVVFAGCDGFLDYRIWLDQREAGLEPFMRESREIGFTARRVFLAGSKAQNGVLDLFPANETTFYAQLPPFVAYQNAHGIIPLLTVFVDCQDTMPSAEVRRQHWRNLTSVLGAQSGVVYLLSGGNQWSKNHFDPWADISDPGPGIIWSRGSDVDDVQTEPQGAPASELHSTRVSLDRSLMDSVASPINMREHGASLVWMTEGPPWDENGDPAMAWKLGRGYSIDWGLAIFHNRQGQRGQLLKPGTRACAEAWVRGMRL